MIYCLNTCWYFSPSLRQWKQYYVILKDYELRFFKDQKSASHVSHTLWYTMSSVWLIVYPRPHSRFTDWCDETCVFFCSTGPSCSSSVINSWLCLWSSNRLYQEKTRLPIQVCAKLMLWQPMRRMQDISHSRGSISRVCTCWDLGHIWFYLEISSCLSIKFWSLILFRLSTCCILLLMPSCLSLQS